MNNHSTDVATATVDLTPTQLRGLKLAKDGDLYPNGEKKWTHLNAEVSYARTDRFKERPIKVKFVTTTTLDQLKEYGFLRSLNPDASIDEPAYGITMAGKVWLLKHK